jgi:hypothetical protein
METTAAASAAPAPRLNAAWLGAITLFLFSLVWRLPYAISRTFTDADELWYSLPTSERMARGEWLLYISGTNYGAPFQEFLASVLIRFFGVSEGIVRLPVVLLGAVGVVIAYFSLRTVLKERVAFALAVLLALPSSGVAHYSAFAHPSYATVFILCGVIQLLTFRLARKSTPGGWWALAGVIGLAFYAFKLSLLQSAVSLAWLWWRSDHAARCRARIATPEGQRTFRWAIGILACAALLLAPVAYHYLTRRKAFAIAPWETGLLLASGAILGVGAVFLVRVISRPTLRELWPALACAAALVLIPLPAKIWYERVEAPRRLAAGDKFYPEASYSLKHFHEWPRQIALTVQGIIPAMALGNFDELNTDELAMPPIDWRTVFSVVLLGLLAWFGGRRLHAAGWRVPLSAGDTVLIAPFLVTAAIMFPSWMLFNEFAFRYLLPFLPGALLLIYRALEAPITRWPRVATGVVAVLLVQNAVDCYWHLR